MSRSGMHENHSKSYCLQLCCMLCSVLLCSPWWPDKTVDAVWCVELLEHVGRNFHKNLMPAMRQAAFLYVTHSTWGGWHHVEVHEEEWWIARFQSFGFVYSDSLSQQVRQVANLHADDPAPNGKTYYGQHIWLHMLVFINPAIASLPQHAHLLAEDGCTDGNVPEFRRKCGSTTMGDKSIAAIETTLPPSFQPLNLTVEMDAAWEQHVFGTTNISVVTVA